MHRVIYSFYSMKPLDFATVSVTNSYSFGVLDDKQMISLHKMHQSRYPILTTKYSKLATLSAIKKHFVLLSRKINMQFSTLISDRDFQQKFSWNFVTVVKATEFYAKLYDWTIDWKFFRSSEDHPKKSSVFCEHYFPIANRFSPQFSQLQPLNKIR